MLSEPMSQRLEGVHVGFLQQVKDSKSKRLRYGSWCKAASKNTSGSGDTAATDPLGQETGDSGAVCGPTSYFQHMCDIDRI